MARTKYGYAESSNIKATIAGHNFDIKNDTLPIENGTLWKLGELTQPNEIYAVTKPAKGDKVVLALSALYSYDTSTTLGQHEMFLRKEAGETARAYEIVEHDRYAVIDYMIKPVSTDTGVVAGNYIVVNDASNADTTYQEVASTGDVSAYGFVAKVVKVEVKSNMTIVRLDVIKNATVVAAAGKQELVYTNLEIDEITTYMKGVEINERNHKADD